MKAAQFEYHAPTSTEEAASVLNEHGDEAKVLAGGQSLVPILALRLARFAHLVDLNHVPELAGISASAGGLRIGAMTRQSAAEHSSEVARTAPLLSRALPFVGHFQIRNRGTVGGSIAHADPSSELPAVASALGAEMEATSIRGSRRIPATAFFSSLWETTLEPDEVLVALHFPEWPSHSGWGFEELTWRLGDFAIAGAACALSLDPDQRVSQIAIALMGMGPTPLRAEAAEAAAHGSSASELDLPVIGEMALQGTRPVGDVHATADYRRRVLPAIVRRVVRQAVEEATDG